MGIFVSEYKKKMICRYDKDGIIPYLCAADFSGLNVREGSFASKRGEKVAYFEYFYKDDENAKTVLFCPGLGPGHTAYMREIEYFCARGFKVFTLDYIGCDRSDGENMISINEPTKATLELVRYLGIEDFVVVGHSLGGYTALNLIRILPFVKKAVVISGFLSDKTMIAESVKFLPAVKSIERYERKTNPDLFAPDNSAYLRKTQDKIFFVASTDDTMVNFRSSTGYAQTLGNPNLSFVIERGKKHNPNYSAAAVKYMNDVFAEYNSLVKSGKLTDYESKKAYFADKSALKMTEQDDSVMGKIIDFIKE